MEKLKNKHDHALTQWLKVIIFGILLLAPFFSVISKCLYVTCNKNAKDSYSGNVEYTQTNATPLYNTNHLESNNDLIVNNCYLLNFTSSIVDSNDSYITILGDVGENVLEFVSYSNNGYSFALDYGDSKQYDYLIIYTDFHINNNVLIGDNKDDDTGTEIKITHGTGVVNNYVIFKYLGISNMENLDNDFWTYFSEIPSNLNEWTITNEVIEVSTLDNVFEYSVNELNNTPIFNWVQNTAIYTPINAMTSGLGFTPNNNVLALLLTYWTLLTCVYVVFDIVIACFVKITHMVVE